MSQKGFTALELLAVIAVLGILAAIAVPSYQLIRQNVSLSSYSQEIVSALRLAQNRSLSSQDGTTHGVHFETSQYIVYGGDWSGTPTYTTPHPIENGVEVLSASPTEVVFERLTGAAPASTIVIGFPGGKQKTITVDMSGRISTL